MVMSFLRVICFVMLIMNHGSATYQREALEDHLALANAFSLDGEMLNEEMNVINKALRDAEAAIEHSFFELRDKEADIVLLSSQIKETTNLKESLEESTSKLQKQLIDAQDNLHTATDEWHALDSELQRINSGSVLAASDVASCQQWGGLLARSNVELQEEVGVLNVTNLKLALSFQVIERDLTECYLDQANLTIVLEACQSDSAALKVSFKNDLSVLEEKSKANVEKVRKLTGEAGAKEGRIRTLEKSLANRTVATKKAEARSTLLTEQNHKLLFIEETLRGQLAERQSVISSRDEEVGQLKASLEKEKLARASQLSELIAVQLELTQSAQRESKSEGALGSADGRILELVGEVARKEGFVQDIRAELSTANGLADVLEEEKSRCQEQVSTVTESLHQSQLSEHTMSLSLARLQHQLDLVKQGGFLNDLSVHTAVMYDKVVVKMSEIFGQSKSLADEN